MTRTKALLLVIALLLTVAACGESKPTREDVRDKRINDPVRRDSVSASVGKIRLQAIRIQRPEGVHAAGENSPLFLTLANSGPLDRLVAVSSVDATSVVQRDGTQPPPPAIDISVPQGGVVSMQRADGLHLELVGLKRDLGKREFVPVTFRFAQAGTVSVKVFVSGVDQTPVPSASPTDSDDQ